MLVPTMLPMARDPAPERTASMPTASSGALVPMETTVSPMMIGGIPIRRASFAPYWSATASVTYEWDFTDSLMARFNLGAKYMSDYNTGSDLDPEKVQDAYTVVNARVGLGRRDRRWSVEAWALNLTDEDYVQVGFDAPLQTGSWNAFLGAPRTYGLTLRVLY